MRSERCLHLDVHCVSIDVFVPHFFQDRKPQRPSRGRYQFFSASSALNPMRVPYYPPFYWPSFFPSSIVMSSVCNFPITTYYVLGSTMAVIPVIAVSNTIGLLKSKTCVYSQFSLVAPSDAPRVSYVGVLLNVTQSERHIHVNWIL